jgi:hypothetical protein
MSDTFSAKVIVHDVTEIPAPDKSTEQKHSVVFHADAKDKLNQSWAEGGKASPSGLIITAMVNHDTGKEIKVGDAYRLTFTPSSATDESDPAFGSRLEGGTPGAPSSPLAPAPADELRS